MVRFSRNSLTKFGDKKCGWADETPCILSFHFMHVTGIRNIFTKLRAKNVSSYMGICFPLLLSVLTLLLSEHTASFSRLLDYTSLCTQSEHDFICQLPKNRYYFPCSSSNGKHAYNET